MDIWVDPLRAERGKLGEAGGVLGGFAGGRWESRIKREEEEEEEEERGAAGALCCSAQSL